VTDIIVLRFAIWKDNLAGDYRPFGGICLKLYLQVFT